MDLKVGRVQSPDSAAQRFNDSVSRSLSALSNEPLLGGVLVTVAATTAGLHVPHGLGRAPRGWLVTDQTANAGLYRVSASESGPNDLFLRATAAATVTLWVF